MRAFYDIMSSSGFPGNCTFHNGVNFEGYYVSITIAAKLLRVLNCLAMVVSKVKMTDHITYVPALLH